MRKGIFTEQGIAIGFAAGLPKAAQAKVVINYNRKGEASGWRVWFW